MIAATPAPAASNSGGATSAAVSTATPASPFDAILTLEALAATCAALDTAPLGGSALEGGGLEGLDEAGGADTDDGDDADGENGSPLAFLVNLLNFAAPTTLETSGGADAVIDTAAGGQANPQSGDAAGA